MSRFGYPRREAPGISRRVLMLLGLQLGAVGVLGWRMRQLQVENAERYRMLAEENRINIRLLPPARGLIFDRQGRPLAINRQNYRIVMIREQAGPPEAALDRLGQIIEIGEAQRARILKEVRQKSAFVPVTVAEHLDWDAFSRVATNGPALPGIVPEVGLTRFYPEPAATAHVVGYVGPVSEPDLKNPEDQDPLLQIPRFQIGKSGIERLEEAALRGQAGLSRIEVNAVGRVMRELDREEGAAGTNLQLTLDLSLQRAALQRMAGESAATVVIEVETGDVVALASSPAFDANLFVFGISATNWGTLMGDRYRPLANKTVSGTYPPGSTFKMTVALAALHGGIVSTSDTVFCGGSMAVGDRRFHCWRRGGHGTVDMREAIKSSCDVYFYEVARRVGVDAISAMGNQLGLGIRHDLPLPAIAEGLMPTREWKKRTQGVSWQVGDGIVAGIGQGYVLASPLQLAVMTARIAGGRARGCTPADPGGGRRAGAGAARPGARHRPAPPRRRARGHGRRVQRPARHRLPHAHRRPRDGHGGQDRDEPGPPDQRG